MSSASGSFSVELVKLLFPVEEVAHSTLHIPLEQGAKAWGYPLLSISTSSLLFPHDFDTASFLLFSDRELKELSVSLGAWPKQVEAGPSSSSRVRNMSEVRSSPQLFGSLL